VCYCQKRREYIAVRITRHSEPPEPPRASSGHSCSRRSVRRPESRREQCERRGEKEAYVEDFRDVLIVRDLVSPALLDECLELDKSQRLGLLQCEGLFGAVRTWCRIRNGCGLGGDDDGIAGRAARQYFRQRQAQLMLPASESGVPSPDVRRATHRFQKNSWDWSMSCSTSAGLLPASIPLCTMLLTPSLLRVSTACLSCQQGQGHTLYSGS
jgi:hypothetical protein